MKHSIRYDSDSGAIAVKIVGDVTIEDATEVIEKLNVLLGDNTESNVLVDFTQSPNLSLNRETRRMAQEAGRMAQETGLNFQRKNVAFVGISPVMRMMVKVILAVVGKIKESRFYETEEEALAWLKGVQK